MFCNWKDKNLSLKNRLIAHKPVSLGHSQRSTIWVSIWPNYESNCYFSWAVAPFLPSMTWNIRRTNNRDLREDCSISVLSFLDIPSIFSSNSAYLCNPFDSSCVSLQLLEKKKYICFKDCLIFKTPLQPQYVVSDYFLKSSRTKKAESPAILCLLAGIFTYDSTCKKQSKLNRIWIQPFISFAGFFFFFLNQ